MAWQKEKSCSAKRFEILSTSCSLSNSPQVAGGARLSQFHIWGQSGGSKEFMAMVGGWEFLVSHSASIKYPYVEDFVKNYGVLAL